MTDHASNHQTVDKSVWTLAVLLVLSCLIWAAPTFAEEDVGTDEDDSPSFLGGRADIYAGFSYGEAQLYGICRRGYEACADNTRASGLLVGFELMDNFAIEVEYLNLRRFSESSFDGSTRVRLRSQGYGFSYVGFFPVTKPFSAFVSLGLVASRTRQTSTMDTPSNGVETGFDPSFAVGVKATLSRSQDVRATFRRIDDFGNGVLEASVDMFTIGVNYHF